MAYQQHEEVSINDIVAHHIQKILEMSTHELRKNSRVITTNSSGVNKKETIYEENTLNSYIQAIHTLALILVKDMDETLEKIFKITQRVYFGDKYTFKARYKNILETKKQEIAKPAYYSWLNNVFWPNKRKEAAEFLFKHLCTLALDDEFLSKNKKTVATGGNTTEDNLNDDDTIVEEGEEE